MNFFNLSYLSFYVRSFLLKMNCMPSPCEAVVVGLSGGRDSVLLLKLMAEFQRRGWVQQTSALYIDYLTWGQRGEHLRKGLYTLCQKENVYLNIIKCPLSKQTSNFEMKARALRFREFQKYLDNKTWIVLGHHINDSLEWSFMQQMKTSSPRGILGIPLKRYRYLRPFMCLTRQQISHFCHKNKIPYWDDPSNQNNRWERNVVRQTVLSPLKKLYPKMEKHYVLRHNQLAIQYGVHPHRAEQLQRRPAKQDILLRRVYDGIVMVDQRKQYFLGKDENLIKVIKVLSASSRGLLGKEVSKISKALENNKRGPLVVSGGVRIYLASHRLLFLKKNSCWFDSFDRQVGRALGHTTVCAPLSFEAVLNRELSLENLFTQYIILQSLPSHLFKKYCRKRARAEFKMLNSMIHSGGPYLFHRADLLRLGQQHPQVLHMALKCQYS